MNRVETINTLLSEGFAPLACQIDDESALHAGHAGAASGGGHYRLRLVSARFEGLGKVGRHRLVYDCLRELMQKEIHALAMTLLTPAEAAEN
jgi:BolA family transcriptional regulator, general stress-responsive regulator